MVCSRPAAAANETLAAAQQIAAALLGGVTPVVLLENMMNAAAIRSADERQEVSIQRVTLKAVPASGLSGVTVCLGVCHVPCRSWLLYLPPQPSQLLTHSAVISDCPLPPPGVRDGV